MTHLNREEFASALAKGLGRAAIHVRQHGLDDVTDLILEACLHNQVYDTQCESGRAEWLFAMFNGTKYYTQFRDAILAAMEQNSEGADLDQLVGLAKEMAMQGDEEARTKVKNRILELAKMPSEWFPWSDELIAIEGKVGVLEIARVYGQKLIAGQSDYYYAGLLREEETRAEYKRVLAEHESEPEIKAYLDYVAKCPDRKPYQKPSDAQIEVNKQKRREQFRQEHSLESIVQDARKGVLKFPVHYVKFGNYATKEEIEKIYALILSDPDDSVRMRLLYVFRRTPLPRLDDKFFDWANGVDRELRRASIAALAQVSDKQVHDLAQAKAKAGEIARADSEALDLFIENYDSSDAHLITDALSKVKPDAEDAHDLARSVIELAEQHEDPALADALLWVYENNPCTNCREKTVEFIDKFHRLSTSIIQECLFDATEEIREFARKLNKESTGKA